MATHLLIAFFSALLLAAAQVPHPEADSADIASQKTKQAAKSHVEKKEVRQQSDQPEQREQREQPQEKESEWRKWLNPKEWEKAKAAEERRRIEDDKADSKTEGGKKEVTAGSAGPAFFLEGPATSPADDLKNAADAASSAAMDAEKVMESAEQSSAMHSVQELHGLSVAAVMDKAASWHSAGELEAQQEKAFLQRRKQAQSELDNFVQKLEALPMHPTNTSSKQAEEFLASARKADEELNALDKEQGRAMHRALRRAEHAAYGQVKSLERAAFHAAHAMKAQGSKLEKSTQERKVVAESIYERAQDEIEGTSERLSQEAESAAERFQGHMEGRFDVLADQVDDRIDAMRQRGRERHEKTRATLSKLAEKARVGKKQGAKGTSFLEAATSSAVAKGSASFMAGLLASMVGVFAVIQRRRLPALVSEAPLLG